jgi:hypothetical protein
LSWGKALWNWPIRLIIINKTNSYIYLA